MLDLLGEVMNETNFRSSLSLYIGKMLGREVSMDWFGTDVRKDDIFKLIKRILIRFKLTTSSEKLRLYYELKFDQ